jgi:glucose/arabinose dehydrogenase
MTGRTVSALQAIRTAILAAGLLGAGAGRLAATVPANFTDALVAAVGAPTSLAFTPDGRLLITTQSGALRVYKNGALLATPALSFASANLCSNSERGLLGVAVDPNFAANQFLYLYYTFNKFHNTCPGSSTTSPVNRVSRFVLADTDTVDPATETVLLDNMPSFAGNHNGGDLHFGRDGYLYVSIGDSGCDYAGDSGCGGANDASRDQNVLLGKVLRIAPDGSIPPTNPFQGAGTARCNATGSTAPGNKCQETFAWGLRNPFRTAFDPNAAGTRFFINDVGQDAWEEIDDAQAGTDYGWNCREGRHANNSSGPCSPTPPGMVDPIFEYAHGSTVPGTASSGCNSITGGAFVPNGLWPGFDGAYLFSDFICGSIFKLTAPGGTFAAADFATALGGTSVVALAFGPFGNGRALYYTTYAGGGQVRRISYQVAGDNPPAAMAAASPTNGPVPLAVTFDATGSSDPDGDALTYFWDFGDGTPETTTTSLTIGHTYATAGVYTATLHARDGSFAFSAPATVQVQPGALGPLDFHSLAPCRAVDTRGANGPLGGPALAANATRTFALAGVCGIPPTAQALALNLTVVGPTAAGHLTLFPAAGAVPATSAINFAAGQVRANNAVVALGGGGLSVLCAMPGASTVHLVIDVDGYFE